MRSFLFSDADSNAAPRSASRAVALGLFVAFALAALGPVRAQDGANDHDVAGVLLSEPAGPDVGSLLDALAQSDDADSADLLTREIQRGWNQSGSASVDLLMTRATLAMQARDFPLALDLLDSVVVLAPAYAEGWNRRATVHFMREDYALSIADVEQVLRLEPRHFGALSGIAMILDELGRYGEAARFFEAALAVHPFLDGARQRLEVIERRLEGAPI